MIRLLFAGAVVAFAGCMQNPDTESPTKEDGPGTETSELPGLYTELDSIVFRIWDYGYMARGGMTGSELEAFHYSERGIALLTGDTAKFAWGKSYQWDEDGADFLYAKTKFNPKGWLCYLDSKNDMARTLVSSDPAEIPDNWLLAIRFEPGSADAPAAYTYERPSRTPITYTLYTMHFQGYGFVFDPASQIGNNDGGSVRIYYWR